MVQSALAIGEKIARTPPPTTNHVAQPSLLRLPCMQCYGRMSCLRVVDARRECSYVLLVVALAERFVSTTRHVPPLLGSGCRHRGGVRHVAERHAAAASAEI